MAGFAMFGRNPMSLLSTSNTNSNGLKKEIAEGYVYLLLDAFLALLIH